MKDIEQNNRKSIFRIVRSLHRDIGFFVIGLVVIYSLSGIILIYRNTGFLRHEVLTVKTLESNIELPKLGKEIYFRDIELEKTVGDLVYFNNGTKNKSFIQQGTYNKSTGVVKYTERKLPALLGVFNGLHKASSSNIVHWATTLFGVLLLFLAISSFWMFKPSTKMFRRGMILTISGNLVAIILLLIL